ncbi:MAG TPA: hypothetical protein VIM79_10800 [Niastella sp.]
MLFKQFSFAFIISTFLASCANTPTAVNCKRYRTGKFRFSANFDGKVVNYLIDRNNSTQTEQCAEMNSDGTYKISWKDDCTYLLAYMSGKDSLPPEQEKLKRKMVIETTILGGTEDYYIFESTNNMYDKVMKDTMWVIK